MQGQFDSSRLFLAGLVATPPSKRTKSETSTTPSTATPQLGRKDIKAQVQFCKHGQLIPVAAISGRPSILKPALSRQLTSVSEGGMSDGTGPVDMQPIGKPRPDGSVLPAVLWLQFR